MKQHEIQWTAKIAKPPPTSRDEADRDIMLDTCQGWARNINRFLQEDNGLTAIQQEALQEFSTHVSRHRQKAGQIVTQPSANGHKPNRREPEEPPIDVEGVDRVYYKLPPGMGKTNIAIAYVRSQYIPRRLAVEDAHTGEKLVVKAGDIPKTLFVVPTRNLREQTLKRFQKFAPELFVTDEKGEIDEAKSLVAAIRPRDPDIDKPVNIMSYPLYVRRIKEGTLDPLKYDLLVLDEVHESLTEPRIYAAEKFERALKLGLTATDAYSEGKQVSQLLGTCLMRKNIIEGATDGYLCGFKNILIYPNVVDLDDIPLSRGNYSERVLAKRVDIKARTLAAIEQYANYIDTDTDERIFGKRGIVNCVGVSHAAHVADLFNEMLGEQVKILPQFRGKNVQVAAVIHGGMSDAQVEDMLERHRKGEILLLCQTQMLGRGHDDPGLSVCFNLRPTLSKVEAEQRGGRIMRNEHFAYIFDIVDKGRKNTPVLFAEVAGGAYFIRQEIPPASGKNPQPYRGKITVNGMLNDLPNMRVVCEQEELLKVVRSHGIKEYPDLPANKMHWLPPTRALRLLGKASGIVEDQIELNAILARFAADKERTITLPKGIDDSEPAGEYHLHELSGKFRFHTNKGAYFDPRLLPLIASEMGVISTVPPERQHWVPPVEKFSQRGTKKVREACERLLADPEREIFLEKGIKDTEPAGNYKIGSLIATYRNGSNPVLYCDPRLLDTVSIEMGFYPKLPASKYHWVPRLEFMRKILHVPDTANNKTRFDATLENFLATPERKVTLPKGINDSEPAGEYRLDRVIGNYQIPTGNGHQGIYIDPRLAEFMAAEMELSPRELGRREEEPGKKILPKLPDDNQHWLPASVALLDHIRVIDTPENREKFSGACQQLLSDNQQVILQEGKGRKQVRTYNMSELIGEYRRGQYSGYYIDPRVANLVSDAMGVVPQLPNEKSHWILPLAVFMTRRDKVSVICEDLLATPDKEILLPKGKNKNEPERNYKISEVLGQYRNKGAGSTWYCDPRLQPILQQLLQEKLGLPDKLPDSKQHWVSSREGGTALKIGSNGEALQFMYETLERLLTEPDRLIPIQQITGNPHTIAKKPHTIKDYIGKYLASNGKISLLFDPAAVPFIRQEMGLPTRLPDDKRHFVTGQKACSLFHTNTNAEHAQALGRVIAKLLQEPDREIKVGRKLIPIKEVMGKYEPNHGGEPLYYFDPAIAGTVITKEMVKAEVELARNSGTQTADDETSPTSLRANPRSIKPYSKHIADRTGRSHAVNSEE